MNQKSLFSNHPNEPQPWTLRRSFKVPRDFCVFCGKPDPSQQDHPIPQSWAKTKEQKKLLDKMRWPACGDCNIRKLDRNPLAWLASQHRMRLTKIRGVFSSHVAAIKREFSVAIDRLPDRDEAKRSIDRAPLFEIDDKKRREVLPDLCALICLSAFEPQPFKSYAIGESKVLKTNFVGRFIQETEIEKWLADHLIRSILEDEVRQCYIPALGSELGTFKFWATWNLLYEKNPTRFREVPRELLIKGRTANVSSEFIRGVESGLMYCRIQSFHYKGACIFETTTENLTWQLLFGYATDEFKNGAWFVSEQYKECP